MRKHTTYSREEATKIVDALEVLNVDYELKREQEPLEFEDSKAWGRVPKPQRKLYTITEK